MHRSPLSGEDGIAGSRERLDGIEARRRALTALNEQEFAADPARLRANRMAIDSDTARGRVAVKPEVDANIEGRSTRTDLQKGWATNLASFVMRHEGRAISALGGRLRWMQRALANRGLEKAIRLPAMERP